MGRTLSFAMNVSVDGYVADPDGDLAWSAPSDELFQWWSDRVASTELALYGRRIWEGMSAAWPDADARPGATPAHVEFSARWKRMPKVVFSSTLEAVGWNARLFPGDAVAEIARLKAEGSGHMDVVGATLAASAIRAGLVDEYVLVTHPALVGGGTRFFPASIEGATLSLVETRVFPSGVLLTRYETRG